MISKLENYLGNWGNFFYMIRCYVRDVLVRCCRRQKFDLMQLGSVHTRRHSVVLKGVSTTRGNIKNLAICFHKHRGCASTLVCCVLCVVLRFNTPVKQGVTTKISIYLLSERV